MVTSNILQRVRCVRLGQQQATGFTIEVDGRQYLVTAKHLLATSPASTTIDILHDQIWHTVSCAVVEVEPDGVDIIVLAVTQQVSSVLPVVLGLSGAFLSQEVFFVGFPLGLTISDHAESQGFPLPLVKHGIIAAFPNGGGEPFLVDGINNPGFSGGPVVLRGNPSSPTIIGVVSAYKATQEPVFQQRAEIS